MKLKKALSYLAVIIILPLITVNYLENNFNQKNTLTVSANYTDIRTYNDLLNDPIISSIKNMYKKILEIDGIEKSKLPLPRTIEVNYFSFKFNVISNKNVNYKEIENIILNEAKEAEKKFNIYNEKLKDICIKNNYAFDICYRYFVEKFKSELGTNTKVEFVLNDIKSTLSIKKNKFNKSNTIILSFIFSLIIISLIEIFYNFKKIINSLRKFI